MPEEPIYVDPPAAFGRWLRRHLDSADALWVGVYTKATGRS